MAAAGADAEWNLNPIVDAAELARGTAELKENVWHVITPDGGPGRRMGPGVAMVGEHLIVFGGADPDAGPQGDVHVLHLGTLEWSVMSCSGNVPDPRYEVGLAAVPGAPAVVLFGGASHDSNFNDVHVLDLSTATWELKKTEGDAPSPRTLHHFAVAGRKAYVYGGGEMGKAAVSDSNVHALDLDTWTWTTHAVKNAPPPRQGHSMDAVGDNLVLFGGMGLAEMYHDVWMLDTKAMAWTCIGSAGGKVWPSPRGAHASAVIGHTMYIAGGLGMPPGGRAAPSPLDDVYALDVGKMEWTVVKSKTAPYHARLGHRMVAASLLKPIAGAKVDVVPRPHAVSGAPAVPIGAAGPRIEDVTPKFSDDLPKMKECKGVVTDGRYTEATCGGAPARGLVLLGGMDLRTFFEDTFYFRPKAA